MYRIHVNQYTCVSAVNVIKVALNKMHPGDVPECLRGLIQVEEMLIAKAYPFIKNMVVKMHIKVMF